jgi:hypothetical protein
MTEILTENQVCYWLVVGIILGAAIVGVFVGRYIYDITVENKEIRRQNARIRKYLDRKSRPGSLQDRKENHQYGHQYR